MIVALAGRRIDAQDAAVERFPQRCVASVRERIRSALQRVGGGTIVSAAACGTDLIALSVAQELGWRRHIVIPSPLSEFRTHSVVDRPGGWGTLFDLLVAAAQSAGDLELIDLPPDSNGYVLVNSKILDRAVNLANETPDEVIALAVWDGPLEGRTDYTQDFVQTAQARGIGVRTIGII